MRFLGSQFRPTARRLALTAILLAGTGLNAFGQAPAAAGETANAETATRNAAAGSQADDPYALREKGIKALADGLLPIAAGYFQRYRDAVGQKEPDFADATIHLIKTLLLQRDIRPARQALDYHAKQSPGVDDPYYRDAVTYWNGAILLAEGEAGKAIEAVQPLLVRQNATAEFRSRAMALVGDAQVRLQRWAEAADAYRRLLQAPGGEADAARVRLQLAQTLIMQRKFAEAAEMLDQLQAAPGTAAHAERQLGRVLLETARGELDQALTLYRAIQPLLPAGPDARWWIPLSQLLEKLVEKQRYQEALPLVAQAELLAPEIADRSRMRLLYADLLIELERREDAIAALTRFRQAYPEDSAIPAASMKLGELLRQQQQPLEAATLFEQVADDAEAGADLRYRAALQRGWCFVDSNRHDDATQAFAKAAKLGAAPDETAQALFYAGDAAYQAGNYTNAAMYYQNVADNFANTAFAENARFRQARARTRAELYANAALIYKQFLEEFPESKLRPEAQVERGVVLRRSGDFAQAVGEFSNFIRDFPDNPLVPRALMEAYAAAKAAEDIGATIGFLTQLINRFPQSELYPHALYQRIHVHLLYGHNSAALADAKLFLDKFIKLPLAADVLLWLGDYYANIRNFAEAEEYYLRAAAAHPDLPQAQTALYEAARCAYDRDQRDRALRLLDQLNESYAAQTLPQVHAQVALLYGDILSEAGKYAEALARFELAHELIPNSALGLAAYGRVGDMYYSLGTAGADDTGAEREALQHAVEIFTALAEDPQVSADAREKARYRLAKAYEKLGQVDAAVRIYLDIVYEFDLDLQNGKTRDWVYLARSGYDAARLLLAEDKLEDAARVYERLARTGIPTADEARARAAEIRETQRRQAGASPLGE